MITQVSKNKAIVDGRQVNLHRVTIKTYCAGKPYIRVYVNHVGNVGFDITKFHGRASKGNLADYPSILNRVIDTVNIGSYPYKSKGYLGDKGLHNNHSTALYEYNTKTIELINMLYRTQDVHNTLRLVDGFNDQEIEKEFRRYATSRRLDFDSFMDY